MESTASRTHFGILARPQHFVGGGTVPLSDHSPFLAEEDPATAKLFARKDRAAAHQEQVRRDAVVEQREVRQRELARRKCERETFENYIQTPFVRGKSDQLAFGFNVYDGDPFRLCMHAKGLRSIDIPYPPAPCARVAAQHESRS